MAVNAVLSARGSLRVRRILIWVTIVGLLTVAAACGNAQRSAGSSGTNGSQRTGPATHARVATPGAGPAPMPAACRQWACRARQTVDLPDNHTVTLWLGTDRLDYQSRPVIELRHHGVAVQSWVSPQGDGWNASLVCLTSGAEPNCVLVDSVGMHASVAEMVILRGGRLVHPAGAQVVTNSAGVRAADLNSDGYLDVIASTNDYRPNYAQGHTYWQTSRYSHGRFVVTGCAPKPRGAAAPTYLLTGTCPTE
jgi:hypothetical protein